jgi:hypothetical protein
MTDKLRATQPLKISFANGEQPSGAKLNALATQSRRGSSVIEKAIGDLWAQSGDVIYNTHPLRIPNLSRAIGKNELLNPSVYPSEQTIQYTEEIGQKYDDQTEGYLAYPPTGTLPGDLDLTGISAAWVTYKTTEAQVLIAGDFWIDPATGKWRCITPVVTGNQVKYNVDTSYWTADEQTLPGIIPDPRQNEFTGCRISLSSGKYLLHLPPKRPLDFTGEEYPNAYPASIDVTNNQASADGAPFKFFNDAVTAITGATSSHYRYALPKAYQDATITSGDVVLDGAAYLFDLTTNTIITDVVFRKPTDVGQPSYVLEISSESFDFSSLVTASEAEANYSSSNLVLVVCGASVSAWVKYLAILAMNHTHDNSTEGSLVSHTSLLNKNPPTSDFADHTTTYPTYLPAWSPSNWSKDDHTYLLSRAGAQATARKRDKYNNAMLGDFLIANADTSGADNYLDNVLPNGSFKIYFGDITGPSIYIDSSSIFQFSNSANIIATTGTTGLSATGNAAQPGILGTGGATNGAGVRGTGGGSNGIGVRGQGAGGGEGILGQGGATGNGVSGSGGATSGIGVLGTGGGGNSIGVQGQGIGTGIGVNGIGGATNGIGVEGTGGGASGTGVKGNGQGGSAGIWGIGGATGSGVSGQGGATSGWGVYGVGGGGNSAGVNGQGSGSASGVQGVGGGTSGSGVKGTGGTTNGIGIEGLGTGTGIGIKGTGGATNGTGVQGTGGATNGIGVEGIGTGSGTGIEGTGGAGNGFGVIGTGTGTGRGVWGQGGATNGIGLYGTGVGSGAGVSASGGGSSGAGVIGAGGAGGGTGVKGFSSTGYGVEAEGNTITPSKAALRIVPQPSEPTGANAVGDIYVTTAGVLKICTVAGTPGTWVSVGSQT